MRCVRCLSCVWGLLGASSGMVLDTWCHDNKNFSLCTPFNNKVCEVNGSTASTMTVPRVSCSGDAYQVGYQHGSQAAKQVRGSIRFYTDMFEKYTGRTWDQITPIALAFGETIKAKWPKYLLEMQGIAVGANCPLTDVLALNVRTEIAFGLMDRDRLVSDGCTSLAWTTPEASRMGQNWDWMEEQKDNVIFMTIQQKGMPTIKMVTEGGIIGKIGMNSEGLGLCLNAVRCSGNDVKRIPIHLALRMALESRTLEEAVKRLMLAGTGGSGFLLLGQDNDVVGLEFTSKTALRLGKDSLGRVVHSNHLLGEHSGVQEWPEDDSFDRMKRMRELTEEYAKQGGQCERDNFLRFFDDHQGLPMSICRWQEDDCMDATLFNIVMDLLDRSAVVRIGKPCKPEEVIEFDFKGEK